MAVEAVKEAGADIVSVLVEAVNVPEEVVSVAADSEIFLENVAKIAAEVPEVMANEKNVGSLASTITLNKNALAEGHFYL